MNLVIQKAKGKEYVSIRESYWDPIKRKHTSRTVKNYGRLDLLLKEDPDILEKLRAQAEQFKSGKTQEQQSAFIERMRKHLATPVGQRDMSDGRHILLGQCIYRQIWNKLDMGRKLRQFLEDRKCSFDFPDAVFFMTTARSLMPDSKLAQWKKRDDFLYGGHIKLHHLYRALDLLIAHKDNLVRYVNRRIGKQYKRDVTVALYDVTTYAFESQDADTLRNFGFSKDNKVNQVQVVMGLLIDQNGVPIDYELYPGNTSEFGTMVPLLKKLQKDYNIKRVVVTADRGLNSGANLHDIRSLGMEFVIACRIRNMGEKFKRLIDEDDKWIYRNSQVRQDVSKYRIVDYPRRVQVLDEKTQKKVWVDVPSKLLINYSAKRAKKDQHDRQRLVDKATRLAENPAMIRSELRKGGKSYLKLVDGNIEAQLDVERIKEAEMYDGYYGICYSDPKMSADEVLAVHHSLWQIEESFRISKSLLEARPCFHWTEKRIRAHFLICYLALVFHRLLETELSEQDIEIPAPTLVDALTAASITEVRLQDGTVGYVKSANEGVFEQVAKAMGLGVLPHFSNAQEVKKILKLRNL